MHFSDISTGVLRRRKSYRRKPRKYYDKMKSVAVIFIILGVYPFLIAGSSPHENHESHHRHNRRHHHGLHHNHMHNHQKQLTENRSTAENKNAPSNRNISTSSTVLDRRRSSTDKNGSSEEYRPVKGNSHTQKYSSNPAYNPHVYNRNFNGWSVSTNRLGGNGDRSGNSPSYLPKDVEEIDEETLRRKMFEASSTTPLPTTVVYRTAKGKNINKSGIERRNICMQYKTVQIPVKTTEVYSRPTWRHVSEPCQGNQVCTRVEMVHEPAYRDVIRHKTTKQTIYTCCPGWEKTSKTADSCMKPVCKFKCKNGGTCTKPDTCSCPAGFTGKLCEKDINECKEDKPCDQLCFNTEGSYFCQCREGFYLHSDKQSCKKVGGDNNAFEARDLENEIDQEDLHSRVRDVEQLIEKVTSNTSDLQKKIQSSSQIIENLKMRVQSLEARQQDVAQMQRRLNKFEENARRYDNLLNIWYNCRSNPHNPGCPQ